MDTKRNCCGEKRKNSLTSTKHLGWSSWFVFQTTWHQASTCQRSSVVCLWIPRQVPEKNLFQIKPISVHYIRLRRYPASTHDISLSSGKIKLCQCLIKHCITKMQGRVNSWKVEDKAERRKGCESPVGDYRHSCTFSLTSALDRGEVVKATSRPLYPRESYPVPILQEAVWAGLDGCGELARAASSFNCILDGCDASDSSSVRHSPWIISFYPLCDVGIGGSVGPRCGLNALENVISLALQVIAPHSSAN